jgi:hypothetical protein
MSLLERLKTDPDSVFQSIDEKTHDEVLELFKDVCNPYRYTIGKDGSKHRQAVFSFTNMREDRIREELLTSMCGFLYAVSKEWEPPAEIRRWNLKKKEKKPPFTTKELRLKIDELSALLDIVEENEKKAIEGYTEEEMKDISNIQNIDARVVERMYILMTRACQFGVECDERLREVELAARPFPDVMESINKIKKATAGYFDGRMFGCEIEVPKKTCTNSFSLILISTSKRQARLLPISVHI